jgi:nucleoside-diphosphate-sugar epimerase
MKILILGAGYVGSALAGHFLDDSSKQHEIITTTTSPEKLERLHAISSKAILLHAAQTDNLTKIIEECDAVAIMVAPKPDVGYIETYKNTALAIERALLNRDRPFYILYTSSTRVYESLNTNNVTEETHLHNLKGDAKTLLEAEEIYLRCQNEFVTTCVLRLGGIYGPGRTLQDRARRFSGKNVSVNPNGFTNHIHLDDIINAVSFCIENEFSGLFNLVNDSHPTRKELYDTLCENQNIPLPLWNPDILIPNEIGHKVDNSKIKNAGYQFIQSELM